MLNQIIVRRGYSATASITVPVSQAVGAASASVSGQVLSGSFIEIDTSLGEFVPPAPSAADLEASGLSLSQYIENAAGLHAEAEAARRALVCIEIPASMTNAMSARCEIVFFADDNEIGRAVLDPAWGGDPLSFPPPTNR